MKLEEQVVSLDLAKRLKELGVEQKSLFYHHEIKLTSYKKRTFTITQNPGIPNYPNPSAVVYENVFSAFTVAELGEMLPPYFCSVDAKRKWKWSCEKWSNGTIDANVPTQYAHTEADARAKMLIYLKKNKLI